MTAQPVFTDYDEDRRRIRAVLIVLVLILATLFLFQAMDGVQRASEQAERREHHAKMQVWREGMLRHAMFQVQDTADEPYAEPTGAARNPVH